MFKQGLDVGVFLIGFGLHDFKVGGDDLEGPSKANIIHIKWELLQHLVEKAGLPILPWLAYFYML
jgi:hypothetical protein